MRTVVQRVTRACVRVEDEIVGEISHGLLLMIGVEQGDTEEDAVATATKVRNLRIFEGRTPMDRTVVDVEGGCLVVSQFTLAATVKKGNRPSFSAAEDPAAARGLYERVGALLAAEGLPVAYGEFGAEMAVELINDGPATFLVFAHDGKVVDVAAAT